MEGDLFTGHHLEGKKTHLMKNLLLNGMSKFALNFLETKQLPYAPEELHPPICRGMCFSVRTNHLDA